MSLLIKNSLSAERLRGLVFSERFESLSDVLLNRGTVTSAPVIFNGATFDGVDDKIVYPSLSGVKTVCFWITLGTTTQDVLKLSATHSITVAGGVVSANGFTAPTVYVNGQATTAITTNRSFVSITTATGFTADDVQCGYVSSFGAFKIEGLKVWNQALTAQEILDYFNNAVFNYEQKSFINLPLTIAGHDATNVRTLDRSGKGIHFTFGDGVTPAKYPTKLASKGYSVNGTSQYFISAVDLGLYTSLSFALTFSPNYAVSEDVARHLYGSSASSYYLLKRQTFFGYELACVFGGILGTLATAAVYGSYWKQNQYNTLVVTSNSVTDKTNAWLNGVQITTNLAHVWAPVSTTNLLLGCVGWPGASPTGYDKSSYFNFQVLPFEMTFTQVLDYHQKMMKAIQAV